MTDNPVGEAFAAVVGGMLTSILFPVFTDVLKALEAPPMILAVWFLIPIVGFISGISEANVFGVLYSITLIVFGFYLAEWGSIITGLIALGAHLAGIILSA